MNLKSTIKPFIAALLILFLISCNRELKSPASGYSYQVPFSPANFFNQPEKYLEWQTKGMLDLTEEALLKFPPQITEPIERRMAMLMLDAVFHDVTAPQRPAVQAFHHSRNLHALEEIKNTKVKEGMKIWKLYDMAAVIRTKTVTVGFDLVRGMSAKAKGFALSDSLMKEIINQCDILFISHQHYDHADIWVAQAFLDQGKPVVAPADIFENQSFYKKITHLVPEIHKIQNVPIQGRKRNLEVVIYPGHQGTIINNVTVLKTPEGITFCHTGDQSSASDFIWIDQVGKHIKVDVLMPNCWTSDPLRTAKGYNPKLIIPAHENELGHTIDHREAYALDYSRWNVPFDKIIMTWGESFHYKR